MYSMSVVALYDSEKTLEIYESVKQYIPDELKNRKEYQYKKGDRTHIPLPRESETYNKVLELAKEYNVSIYHTYEFTEYTKEELKNAEYFVMYISDPLESEGTFARDYGTEYTNCCPVCKIGGRPIGDVLVDRKFVKKYGIASLRPDIFVSKEIKWLIEENQLTGVRFERMVKDYQGREIPEYYCMTFENILKPMHEKTWLSYNPMAKKCNECGIEVPYLKSHCYYLQEAFNDAKDFNRTYEFLDNWAERRIIVSKKVKELFSKYKVRVGYEMINIIE